jgi:hypothetical protein
MLTQQQAQQQGESGKAVGKCGRKWGSNWARGKEEVGKGIVPLLLLFQVSPPTRFPTQQQVSIDALYRLSKNAKFLHAFGSLEGGLGLGIRFGIWNYFLIKYILSPPHL